MKHPGWVEGECGSLSPYDPQISRRLPCTRPAGHVGAHTNGLSRSVVMVGWPRDEDET